MGRAQGTTVVPLSPATHGGWKGMAGVLYVRGGRKERERCRGGGRASSLFFRSITAIAKF